MFLRAQPSRNFAEWRYFLSYTSGIGGWEDCWGSSSQTPGNTILVKGQVWSLRAFFPFWGFSFSTDGDLEQNEATPDMDAVSFSTHLTDNKGSLNVSLGQASKWMFGPSEDGYEKKSSEWPYLVWGLAEGADAVGGGSIITRQPPPRSMSESALGVVGFVATAAAWSRGKGIVSKIS